MSPPARHLVLDRIESAFLELATDPHGVVLDGTALGGWLPLPELRLSPMRDHLLKPPHPDAIPSIWRELVSCFRRAPTPDIWSVVVLGALNPGMRGICRRAGLPPSHLEDLQAELVVRVLDSLATLYPEQPHLAGHLYWAARRASSQFRRSLVIDERQLVPLDVLSDVVSAPHAGAPDEALARLCTRAVITEDEADLIGRTRLEKEPLIEAAARLGISYAACRKRRRRAEQRIVRHYASIGVLSAERAEQLLGSDSSTLTATSSDNAGRTTAVA